MQLRRDLPLADIAAALAAPTTVGTADPRVVAAGTIDRHTGAPRDRSYAADLERLRKRVAAVPVPRLAEGATTGPRAAITP
jgi:hypothetical protein